jgi:hypothetical protein
MQVYIFNNQLIINESKNNLKKRFSQKKQIIKHKQLL